MILKKVYFLDRRTTIGAEPIMDVHFENGLSVDFVTDRWIAKFKAIGDGAPFQVIEEEYSKVNRRK
jgi:hypothetical protein